MPPAIQPVAPSSPAVLFEVHDDAIAVITINRPDQRNVLGKAVREGLFAAWARFEADPLLRVAILTGAGDAAFCAGGDLKEMVETGLRTPPRDMFPVPHENIRITKPTIAAVNGVAFAGGWMIAQACDLCVASTSAKFAITEVRVGRGSPWAAPLIHMIPQRIMMEIILTGKPISAERAYQIGLVNRLAEPADLIRTALDLAHEILESAPLSIEAGRATVMLATEMGRADALDAAWAAHERAYNSADAQEGPRAFAEKRKPRWVGV
jgi:enoyl-CoA hydratase